MELVLVVGEDESVAVRARRDALARAGASGTAVERLDVAADGGSALVDAVGAPSMFTDRRVVDCWNFEALDAANLARLRETADASDAFVVARAHKLPAATRRKLPAHELVAATAPQARELPRALREHASRLGVRLTGEQAATLARRCRDRPTRAWSVLDQLALVRLSRPSDRQVETLLGSTWPNPTPWEVAAAAESGDLAGALEMWGRCDDSDAFALVGYLRKALSDLSVARSCAPDELVARTKVAPARAQQLARRARRAGDRELADAVAAVCRCEHELRSSGVRAASVDLALARYARCFPGGTTAGRTG